MKNIIFLLSVLVATSFSIIFFNKLFYFPVVSEESIRSEYFMGRVDELSKNSVINLEKLSGLQWDYVCFESVYSGCCKITDFLKKEYPGFIQPKKTYSYLYQEVMFLININEKRIDSIFLPEGVYIKQNSVIKNKTKSCFSKKDIILRKEGSYISVNNPIAKSN